jgi:UDP-N-acetylmuramate dehydrogenase
VFNLSRYATVNLNVFAKDFTTYRVGGKADCIVTPNNEDDLVSTLKLFYLYGVDHYTIGRGSKLLVSDKGVKKILLSTIFVNDVYVKDNYLYANAGVSVGKLLSTCKQYGLTGLEFLAGIPATVGGLVALNGGAFSQSVFDKIANVTVFSNGNVRTFSPSKDSFGYRFSPIRAFDTVISCTFKLDYLDTTTVLGNIKNYLSKRSNQPKGRSCGSVFKNPDGCFAGDLIERCALKGRAIGGAFVSNKHANFIIANENATATDVYKLLRLVKSTVKDKFNISLEEEVILLGDF